MEYIIVWSRTREYADINSRQEPNRYQTFEDAEAAIAKWLFPNSMYHYYDIIEWTGK
jgi:hypothetical protein